MTPLTRQNDNVLNALKEGILQGRVEALQSIDNLLNPSIYPSYVIDLEAVKSVVSQELYEAKEEYKKWFE